MVMTTPDPPDNPFRPIKGAPDRPAIDREPGRWVTMPEAVAHFGRSERTLRRWMDRGQLRHKNEGGRALVFITALPDTAPDSAGPEPDIAPDAAPVTPDKGPDSDRPTPDSPPDPAEVAQLRADLASAQAALAEVRNERDFLRQALATSMQTQQQLIEGQARDAGSQSAQSQAGEVGADPGRSGDRRRRWWEFWRQ